MIHNLIQTKDYLLIVDKKQTTKWYYNETDSRVDSIEVTPTVIGGTIIHNIIAHLPLTCSPILEGIDLLPPLPDEAKEWARAQWSCEPDDYEELYYDGLEKGYNKAKEKYKYTEDDLRKAIHMAVKHSIVIANDIVQSLQQSKYPVGFECDTDYYGGDVKWKIETITNSQGQTVWMGKYIY